MSRDWIKGSKWLEEFKDDLETSKVKNEIRTKNILWKIINVEIKQYLALIFWLENYVPFVSILIINYSFRFYI